MADFCGFQTLDLAPSVEDRSQAEIRERAAVYLRALYEDLEMLDKYPPG